jgi:hypothetical protein
MADYAHCFKQGRVADEPLFFNIDDYNRTSKAVFVLAINYDTGKRDEEGKRKFRTIFRRIVCWGSNAEYVYRCNEEDTLKGRLVNVAGRDDDEMVSGERIQVTRAEILTVMDRKRRSFNA